MTQAVILVGGAGTRLRPLTDTRPKPMMPLVDRPFVAHQLDLLRRHGVTDVIFSCGYRPDALRAHFGDGDAAGVRLRYVVDPEPLGTAGAMKNAEDLLDGAPFLVLNGDILTDLDLSAVVEAHARTGAAGTVVLTPVEDPSAFGLVRLHDDALRRGLRREALAGRSCGRASPSASTPAPTCSTPRSSTASRRAGPSRSSARSSRRSPRPGVLFGFPSDAYWRDIGTPASYLAAHHDVLSGAATHRVADRRRLPRPGRRRSIPGRAWGRRSSLGPDARVGAGAVVEGSVVGAGTRVGEGAVLRDAILGERRDGRPAAPLLEPGRGGRRRRGDRGGGAGRRVGARGHRRRGARAPRTPCSLARVYGLDGPEALAPDSLGLIAGMADSVRRLRRVAHRRRGRRAALPGRRASRTSPSAAWAARASPAT